MNGPGAMPGHNHDPNYGTAGLPKPMQDYPSSEGMAQHAREWHNIDTHNLTPEQAEQAHHDAHQNGHTYALNHLHYAKPVPPGAQYHPSLPSYGGGDNVAAHLLHHHGVTPDQSFEQYVPGSGQQSGLYGQHIVAHHGPGSDHSNGYVSAGPHQHSHFDTLGLPQMDPAPHTFGDHFAPPEGGIMHAPAHSYTHQDMKVHLNTDHGYDPSHLPFADVVHHHEHLHKTDELQPWESPAHHGHGVGGTPPGSMVEDHPLYHHLTSDPHSFDHYAVQNAHEGDLQDGLSDLHAEDHQSTLESSHAHHTHMDFAKPAEALLHEPPNTHETASAHLVQHHGIPQHAVDALPNPWQHHIDMHFEGGHNHIVNPPANIEQSHPHAHYTHAICENCGEHIKHDPMQGWNHHGDSGCDESPDTDGDGAGEHVPDHNSFEFHPESAMLDKHSSLAVEDFFKMAGV